MNSKLTKERIEWLHYAATGLAANGTEMAMSPQDVIALTECCLAAMDSEPVVFTDERNLHHIAMGRETSLIWGKQNSEAGDIALYRHVQPVVLDRSIFENWWESQNGSPLDGWDSLRTIDGYCDDGIDGQFDAWNACRAAMLAAAPQEVK